MCTIQIDVVFIDGYDKLTLIWFLDNRIVKYFNDKTSRWERVTLVK